jgi:DNA ligase (NAD+)
VAAAANSRRGPFSGQTFVLTGTLAGFSRAAARDFIESRGGKVADSVSRKTTFLVAGENPGSKLSRAKALGVSILNGEELRRMGSGS